MFYIAGNMASQAQWSLLYNEPEQQRRLIELFPGLPLDTYLPYRYPPLQPPYSHPWAVCLIERSSPVVQRIAVSLAGQLVRIVAHVSSDKFDARTHLLTGLVASPIMAQTLIDGQASFWWFAIPDLHLVGNSL